MLASVVLSPNVHVCVATGQDCRERSYLIPAMMSFGQPQLSCHFLGMLQYTFAQYPCGGAEFYRL
jgi:hypothetical protein